MKLPPNPSIELLTTLAKDDDNDVRWAVAKHPSTPVELLTTLAKDDDNDVRWAVAKHPSTPVELLDDCLAVEKADFLEVISHTPHEIAGLRAKLVCGEVDGSLYEGPCCCLVGTLANIRGCSYKQIPGIVPDAGRPAEELFMLIAVGDTPGTNRISALVVRWIDQLAVTPAVN